MNDFLFTGTTTVEPETPIHDDINPANAEPLTPEPTMADVINAVNSMGAQMDWLCQSHHNILMTVEAIRAQLASMGPAGILKAMMGKGGPKNGD